MGYSALFNENYAPHIFPLEILFLASLTLDEDTNFAAALLNYSLYKSFPADIILTLEWKANRPLLKAWLTNHSA